MKRFVLGVAVLVGCLAYSGCSLDFSECGVNGVACSDPDGVCICATGRCAEEDEDCASGLHYVGGRCVPAEEAPSAISSTPASPGRCATSDGGSDGAIGDHGGG